MKDSTEARPDAPPTAAQLAPVEIDLAVVRALPEEVKNERRWVPWKGVPTWADGRWKLDKIPMKWFEPERNASTKRPGDWGTLEQALTAYIDAVGDLQGIGYVLTAVPGMAPATMQAIDLDKAYTQEAVNLRHAIQEASLATWMEHSPGGEGRRILYAGTPLDLHDVNWGPDGKAVEFYMGSAPRFVTVTGALHGEGSTKLTPMPLAVVELLRGIGAAREKAEAVKLTPMPDPVVITPARAAELRKIALGGKEDPAEVHLLDHGTKKHGSRNERVARIFSRLLGAKVPPEEVFSYAMESDGLFEYAASKRHGEDRGPAFLWREIEAARGFVEKDKAMPPAAPLTSEELFSKYGIVSADTIAPEDISWFWYGYIPWGHFVIIEGNPDAGKTTFTLTVLAAASTGKITLPGVPVEEAKREPVKVLYLTAEDSLSTTIIPRLRAAEADMSRVMVQTLDASEIIFPRDIDVLARIVEESGARIVVLDPLNSYLDSAKVNVNSEQDVRTALRPIRLLCEKTGIVVLALRHLNKATDKSAMHRGSGSIAFSAVSRSVLLVARHPEEDGLRVLMSQKGNLARDEDRQPRGFRIRPHEANPKIPKLAWEEGTVEVTADELLTPRKPGPKAEARASAQRCLQALLANGPMLREDVLKAAVNHGFSESTIERASQNFIVKTKSPTDKKKSIWSLAPPVFDAVKADPTPSATAASIHLVPTEGPAA